MASTKHGRAALSVYPSLAVRAAALATLALSAPAFALTWDPTLTNSAAGGGAGTWDKTLTNWFDGASDVVWTDGNTATFANAGGAVTLGAPISALNLQFTGTGYAVTPTAPNVLTLTGGFGTAGAGATIYAGGSSTTNTLAGSATIATTGTSVAYISSAFGNTLNLAGTINQTAVTTAGLSIAGPGTVNYGGTAFAPGKFNVVGGATFNTAGAMTISSNGTYTGVSDTVAGTSWNINAGSAVTAATTLFIGSGNGTSGAVAVNGGTASFAAINVGNNFNNATDTSSVGTLTVAGGTLTNTGATRLGGGLGVGTLNLNGGIYNVGGTIAKGIVTGSNATGSATLNFNGGTLRPTANNLTVGGLTVANVRNGGVVVATNGQTLTISQPLVHSTVGGDNATDGGINKGGGGTLIVIGLNTYTGPTVVTGGGSLQFGNGGTSGNIPAGSAIAVTDSGSILAINRGDDLTLANTVTGTGSISKSGTGTLTLSGTNSHTGGLSIASGGGNVRLTTNTAAGTGTVTINGQNAAAGTLELTGGITIPNALNAVATRNDPTLASPNTGVAHVRNVSGNNTITGNGLATNAGGSGNLIESQAGTLTFTGNFTGNNSGSTFARSYFFFGAGNVAMNGVINNGTASGGANVIKYGAGTLTLAGANTYAGGTTVGGGTVAITDGGSFGTGAVANGGNINLATATTNTVANVISGTGTLTQTGVGVSTVTGANTYTGLTIVQRGTLELAAAAQTPVLGSGATGADVQNGQINFDYSGGSPAAAIRGLLAGGFADATTPGVMDSGQLRSSTATATRGLGYRDTGTAVIVKAALFGDADLDGGVSINDFNALAGNFGSAGGKVWTDGDFDYDGGVSINDFNLLAGGFGQSLPTSSDLWAGLLAFAAAHDDLAAFEAVTGVPEPTSLGLLAAGATLGLRRRRRV